MAIEVRRDNANGFDEFTLYRIEGIETTQYTISGMRCAPREKSFVGYVMAREIAQAVQAISAQSGPNRNIEIKSCVEVPSDYLLLATGNLQIYIPKNEVEAN